MPVEYKKLYVLFLSPFNGLYTENVVVTDYDHASFHSLNHNNIRDEGCAALSAALQECKELQQLK